MKSSRGVVFVVAGSLVAGCAPAALFVGGVAVAGGGLLVAAHEGHQMMRGTAGVPANSAAGPEDSSFPPPSTPLPTTAPVQSMAPQVVVPATGGPPVVATPVGGNVYVPVTGGAPITGIPTH
ncbi:MAG TPA: hypothetical protein VGG74_23535 [Kofleriaceae bacterium]|jgi:hypothetical protein